MGVTRCVLNVKVETICNANRVCAETGQNIHSRVWGGGGDTAAWQRPSMNSKSSTHTHVNLPSASGCVASHKRSSCRVCRAIPAEIANAWQKLISLLCMKAQVQQGGVVGAGGSGAVGLVQHKSALPCKRSRRERYLYSPRMRKREPDCKLTCVSLA